ncbi:MAG: RdgB/HAM1 family non-canonical purine NTP pyrophosphatase [Nanoarchaeota archaeon]|nr:RdgB/HAM1 family non-canonical purine NTP pyrophosphatase [Nanoarchaeota archaeon]MBU1004806.1 RdgB/HAM1 family non-canonical purine NTP pyrophosphatase [Nanoarchaeota archaeon]MBU1946998.1 RdgB/HAM1 family non-canonical purine NTP pyrophosphatase [Nanoarchaeota archaeon]
MITLNLVTSNKNKVREFQQILGDSVKLNHIFVEYPEMRSDDPEEIARLAAKQLADKLKMKVIVEDSGMFIKALNGFPGTCSAYAHKRIGLKGIIRLMKGVRDREARYMSAVGYCEPGKKSVSFLGVEKGKIALKIMGKNGFGHDPIFIPEDSQRTYGEMENSEEKKQFRRRAVLKLLDYLKK